MDVTKIQIIYPEIENTNEISSYFKKEAICMESKGFHVGVKPKPSMTGYLYRGYTGLAQNMYLIHKLPWANSLQAHNRTLNMTEFLDIINPWSFPSCIIPVISKENLNAAMRNLKCDRLFIKNDISSLFFLGDNASVYPDTSVKELKHNFESRNLTGPYIARKYIEDTEIFYHEQRHWVVNGKLYYSHGPIDDFVYEAARRIYEFSSSKYFTIDVAGNYIVEVNPGESSDRGGDNPLEWFCDIFAKEFLHSS